MSLHDQVRRELHLLPKRRLSRRAGSLPGLLGLVAWAGLSLAEAPPSFRMAPAPGLASFEVGRYSNPDLVDLDADGDLDLLTSTDHRGLVFLLNTGTASLPAFIEAGVSGNPFRGTGARGTPELADLDGDGDFDLILGDYSNGRFFENTGSARIAHFRERSGSANPFGALTLGNRASPELRDLDGDGDLDAVFGEADSKLSYFRNTGSSSVPAFVAILGSASPFAGLNTSFYLALEPVLGDLDGDGDLDLLTGHAYGQIYFSRNTGSSSAPAFQGFGTPPFGTLSILGSLPTPALADLDGDGDRDLVAGESRGAFFYFEETGSDAAPAFVRRFGTDHPLADGFRSPGSAPTSVELADVDHDGDLDALIGVIPSSFFFLRNSGGAATPAFTAATGSADPFADVTPTFGVQPALADLDGDGDFELVLGTADGTLRYFENTGSDAAPAHLERTGSAGPFGSFDAGDGSFPELADLDGDGDLDAVIGHDGAPPAFLENTGGRSHPHFTPRTGTANPLAGITLAESRPALADFDGDGDLDLVLGSGDFPSSGAALAYFENTGSAGAAAFVRRDGSAAPLAHHQYHWSPSPTAGDLDGDGFADLLLGEIDGRLVFLQADRSGIFADGFESGDTAAWSATAVARPR